MSARRRPHVCRLSPSQVDYLLRPIDEQRVQVLDDKGAFLNTWDVRRWLIRIFGVGGWGEETLDLTLLRDQARPTSEGLRHDVAYRAQVRLHTYAPCGHPLPTTDQAAACGTSDMPDYAAAHHEALTSALSTALKRCAINLGDTFGLSLYNQGSRRPVVQAMLPYDPRSHPPAEDAPLPREAPEPQGEGAKHSGEPELGAEARSLIAEAASSGVDAEDVHRAFREAFGHGLEQATPGEIKTMVDALDEAGSDT
ncbi:Rad52/Rad22 family DNA repair protein [Streptomyces albidoflavus]|uniref:Rad52/Rad22 family DNA repair protein n=1 Tax=Streptomyces albidoflavus TaxID=1886 RepID=UPI00188C6843|nr:Rad52/Rad22 family DNA repair protein [Streptomyces albidoflavus]MBF4138239.1 hypothetical protein [Streptomyces albidoflavus]